MTTAIALVWILPLNRYYELYGRGSNAVEKRALPKVNALRKLRAARSQGGHS